MHDDAIHPAVRVGHVHLRVADLDRSLAFYRDALGLRVTADAREAGLDIVFLAAGDYHHHLALNTLESAGGPPPAPGHTGLYHVAFLYPDRRELGRAVRRLLDHGYAVDHATDHGGTVVRLPRGPRRHRRRALRRPPALRTGRTPTAAPSSAPTASPSQPCSTPSSSPPDPSPTHPKGPSHAPRFTSHARRRPGGHGPRGRGPGRVGRRPSGRAPGRPRHLHHPRRPVRPGRLPAADVGRRVPRHASAPAPTRAR